MDRDSLDFRVGPLRQGGFAPAATLELRHVRVHARLLLLWDLTRSKLAVSFLEMPTLEWDVELALGCLELPDIIEDRLLPWAIARQLGTINADNPIQIDLNQS